MLSLGLIVLLIFRFISHVYTTVACKWLLQKCLLDWFEAIGLNDKWISQYTQRKAQYLKTVKLYLPWGQSKPIKTKEKQKVFSRPIWLCPVPKDLPTTRQKCPGGLGHWGKLHANSLCPGINPRWANSILWRRLDWLPTGLVSSEKKTLQNVGREELREKLRLKGVKERRVVSRVIPS